MTTAIKFMSVWTCLAAAIACTHAGFHRLQPVGQDRFIHCAGQDPAAFHQYTAFMANGTDGNSSPAVMMTYTGLSDFNSLGAGLAWANGLISILDNVSAAHANNQGKMLLPQIGLALPHGSDLDFVANSTKYDTAVHEFAKALVALRREAFVRIGYEFNGNWNDYPADAYIAAFRKIVAPWPPTVARIWDGACDAYGPGRLNFSAWYPGDDVVDWWGINIFGSQNDDPSRETGGSCPQCKCTTDFIAAAQLASYPVVIGESTPRNRGTLDSAAYAIKHTTTGLCLGVNGSVSDPGASLELVDCASKATAGSANAWFLAANTITSTALVNIDGLCVAVSNMSPTPGTPSVTWTCGSGVDKVWSVTHSGGLRNGMGTCLAPATTGKAVVTAACDESATQSWSLYKLSNTDAQSTWKTWYEPYLSLAHGPTVQMGCYIDWNWRDHSNHDGQNWYNWGDGRVESSASTYIGSRWRTSMSSENVINLMDNATVCSLLHC
eukprot:m.143162 g.143162  ORF g.143162 m.143162 type:complete len:494 (-) comp17690_c0_seq2:359-1840(-)